VGRRRKDTEGPLVVINGCETAAMSLRELGSLIDDLMVAAPPASSGRRSRPGVAAREAGVEFLRAFQQDNAAGPCAGCGCGYLAKGNLMGLAYTPYCRPN